MEVARPPLLLALILVCITVTRERSTPATRGAAFLLDSEAGLRNYGRSIAADGPRIASIDGGSEQLVLRIDRVDHETVTAEARIALGPSHMLAPVAMRGDTVVVHTVFSDRLRFFTRVRARGTNVQTLEVPDTCRDPVFHDVHLGDGVLVVESRAVWCVVERGYGRWSFTQTIPHEAGAAIRVSRGRILVLSAHGNVEQYERTSGGWRRTAAIEAPDGAGFASRFAASDRWLAVVARSLDSGDEQLCVYDLDAHGRLVASLEIPAGRRAQQLAVGASTLVITDDIGGFEWALTDQGWRAQDWLEGFSSPDLLPVTIGSVIWIGEPRLTGNPAPIRGFVPGGD